MGSGGRREEEGVHPIESWKYTEGVSFTVTIHLIMFGEFLIGKLSVHIGAWVKENDGLFIGTDSTGKFLRNLLVQGLYKNKVSLLKRAPWLEWGLHERRPWWIAYALYRSWFQVMFRLESIWNWLQFYTAVQDGENENFFLCCAVEKKAI